MPYTPGLELIKFMDADDRLEAGPIVIIDDRADPVRLRQASEAEAIATTPKPPDEVRFRSIHMTVTRRSNDDAIS